MPGKLNRKALQKQMVEMYAAMHRVAVEEVILTSSGTTLTFSLPTTEAEEEARVTAALLDTVRQRSELNLTKTQARDKLPHEVPQHLVERAQKALYTHIPVTECKVWSASPPTGSRGCLCRASQPLAGGPGCPLAQ